MQTTTERSLNTRAGRTGGRTYDSMNQEYRKPLTLEEINEAEKALKEKGIVFTRENITRLPLLGADMVGYVTRISFRDLDDNTYVSAYVYKYKEAEGDDNWESALRWMNKNLAATLARGEVDFPNGKGDRMIVQIDREKFLETFTIDKDAYDKD